jgi:hypothetical protein
LRFSRHANLEIRIARCLLPSVVKDRPCRSTVSERNVSAPGGAPCRFGAGTAKKPCKQQKTRRRAPGKPVLPAGLFVRPLGRHSSMLDCCLPGVRNQPHLLRVKKPRYLSGLPGCPSPHQHPSIIPTISRPSSCHPRILCVQSVNFTGPCGNHLITGSPLRSHQHVGYNVAPPAIAFQESKIRAGHRITFRSVDSKGRSK